MSLMSRMKGKKAKEDNASSEDHTTLWSRGSMRRRGSGYNSMNNDNIMERGHSSRRSSSLGSWRGGSSRGSVGPYGYAAYNPYGGYGGGYGSMYGAQQQSSVYGYTPYAMQQQQQPGGSMYYGGSMYAPQPQAPLQPGGSMYVAHSDGYMYLVEPGSSLYGSQASGGSMYTAQQGGSMYIAQPYGSMYNAPPSGGAARQQPNPFGDPNSVITINVSHANQPDPVVVAPTRAATPPRPKTETDIAYEKATGARHLNTNYTQSAQATSYRFLKQPIGVPANAKAPAPAPAPATTMTTPQAPIADASATQEDTSNSTNFNAVYARMYGRAPPRNPNEVVSIAEADQIFANGRAPQRQPSLRGGAAPAPQPVAAAPPPTQARPTASAPPPPPQPRNNSNAPNGQRLSVREPSVRFTSM